MKQKKIPSQILLDVYLLFARFSYLQGELQSGSILNENIT